MHATHHRDATRCLKCDLAPESFVVREADDVVYGENFVAIRVTEEPLKFFDKVFKATEPLP